MNLDYFKEQDKFYQGLQALFNSLNIPVNYIDENPLRPQDILSKTYKDTNRAYQLMGDVYILGMVDDKAFSNLKSQDIFEIKKQENGYDGILIFGVTLTDRKKGLLPTRTQLAEITRAFNREFYYTPVVVVFRYDNFISLANAERQKYKQESKEGEKAGKVSILRDIEIENPHPGHLKILQELEIRRSGKKGINSFEGLYQYWQGVFSVNLLNKKFYTELSNWYFWAIKHVIFPSEPTIHSLFAETGSNDNNKLEAVKQEFKAKNVIRLLTRLLFVWFIKEKKLIPENLFDLEILQKNILKKISPFHEKDSLFKEANKESIYYKAILQNLFFATLNCPVKPDSVDTRERGFRGDESYGKHRGIDYLMRYKKYFKDPDAFLEMVNKVVPFLNGGLFECLDDKDKKIYIDGFSDNMSKTDGVANHLIVPDYLFFGSEEKTDLSSDYGTKNKGTKEASVKGLINILKSYKFTIAENTPIEEDVALDPELLGKVFENLLASYNPETKTTARKQTGSFYTPREIVNYMVDESLIAHLKHSISSWDMEEQELDEKLHKLLSFEPVNPFEHSPGLAQEIIYSLDNCKILDPACGSGAFPMGILQKMVHILQKVDPDNEYWQELQLEKAQKATEGVFVIKDKEERKLLLDEINEAFDETINNPDYARKLFLIENCIYGVDIQPIATQISKLRFFISLVVEQKVKKEKKEIDNFGIRPLPNLETKFVTANTLIGIDKPDGELFYTQEVQEKEAELKAIRHKLFGAKTKATKMKYRKQDEELRNEIADILKKGNLPVESAEQLASWDPYDQNGVSPFFDPEWMFDIKNGFDIVIGNPPYLRIQGITKSFPKLAKRYKQVYESATGRFDLYCLFTEKGIHLLNKKGILNYIMPLKWTNSDFGKGLRKYISSGYHAYRFVSFEHLQVFTASTYSSLIWLTKNACSKLQYSEIPEKVTSPVLLQKWLDSDIKKDTIKIKSKNFDLNPWTLTSAKNINTRNVLDLFLNQPWTIKDVFKNISQGVVSIGDDIFILKGSIHGDVFRGFSERNNSKIELESEIMKPLLKGDDVKKYAPLCNDYYILYPHYEDNAGKTFPYDESVFLKKFPLAYNYLKSFRRELTEKKIRYKTNPKYWYALHRSRQISMFEEDKIITPEISLGTNMTIDTGGFYHNTKCYSLIKNIQIIEDIKYWLAILNSSLMWFFLTATGYVLRGGFFTFKTKYLEPFPLPKLTDLNHQIAFVAIVDSILYLKKQSLNDYQSAFFEKLINGMVFELYFPEHMKERKIDVLQFVEKDIDEMMQGKEFETLNDTQKEKVVTELHCRWSDPDNEIIKRMNSFSEKSPEILKPILEG